MSYSEPPKCPAYSSSLNQPLEYDTGNDPDLHDILRELGKETIKAYELTKHKQRKGEKVSCVKNYTIGVLRNSLIYRYEMKKAKYSENIERLNVSEMPKMSVQYPQHGKLLWGVSCR
jgi:hypothetical protein